jgi:hypothetical protein
LETVQMTELRGTEYEKTRSGEESVRRIVYELFKNIRYHANAQGLLLVRKTTISGQLYLEVVASSLGDKVDIDWVMEPENSTAAPNEYDTVRGYGLPVIRDLTVDRALGKMRIESGGRALYYHNEGEEIVSRVDDSAITNGLVITLRIPAAAPDIPKPSVGNSGGPINDAILKANADLTNSRIDIHAAAEEVFQALRWMEEPEYLANIDVAIAILKNAGDEKYKPMIEVLEKYVNNPDHTELGRDIIDRYPPTPITSKAFVRMRIIGGTHYLPLAELTKTLGEEYATLLDWVTNPSTRARIESFLKEELDVMRDRVTEAFYLSVRSTILLARALHQDNRFERHLATEQRVPSVVPRITRSTPLEETGYLNSWTFRALAKANVNTMSDLLRLTFTESRDLAGVGPTTLLQIANLREAIAMPWDPPQAPSELEHYRIIMAARDRVTPEAALHFAIEYAISKIPHGSDFDKKIYATRCHAVETILKRLSERFSKKSPENMKYEGYTEEKKLREQAGILAPDAKWAVWVVKQRALSTTLELTNQDAATPGVTNRLDERKEEHHHDFKAGDPLLKFERHHQSGKRTDDDSYEKDERSKPAAEPLKWNSAASGDVYLRQFNEQPNRKQRFEKLVQGIYPEATLQRLIQDTYNPYMIGYDHILPADQIIAELKNVLRQFSNRTVKVALEIRPQQIEWIKEFLVDEKEFNDKGTIRGLKLDGTTLGDLKSYRGKLARNQAESLALWLLETGVEVVPLENADVDDAIKEDEKYVQGKRDFDNLFEDDYRENRIQRVTFSAIHRDTYGLGVLNKERPDIILCGNFHALKYDLLLQRNGKKSGYLGFGDSLHWDRIIDNWADAHRLYRQFHPPPAATREGDPDMEFSAGLLPLAGLGGFVKAHPVPGAAMVFLVARIALSIPLMSLFHGPQLLVAADYIATVLLGTHLITKSFHDARQYLLFAKAA